MITWLNTSQKAAGMNALAVRVGGQHTYEWGEDVALKGEQTIRDVIDAGGMNPTKKGGPRIETGAMYSSAQSKTIASAGTAFVRAGFGINTTAPSYTIFQEGGTRKGITPMMAIPMASLEMATELQNSGNKMMAAIQVEWNSI